MHILMIAMGTAGDVYSLLGLSRTFASRGHKVSFCASPVFAGAVERCGLRFLPLGAEEHSDPRRGKRKSSLPVFGDGAASAVRPLFDLLYSETGDDTIIAGHSWAFGARLFQEKFGVPMVTLQVSPSSFLSAKRPPVRKQLNLPMLLPYPVRAGVLWAFERGLLDRICAPEVHRLRAEIGLPPVHRILSRWMHSPQGVLGLFPEWFAQPQSDWPSAVQLTGFPLYDEAAHDALDPEIEEFVAGGDPPIVFLPGSALVHEPAWYQAATEALSALGRRGIFLGSASAGLLDPKSHLLSHSAAPLRQLLPRAQLLVHDGGIGAVSQAFAAGTPQLITPLANDAFDNAARVGRLGCGLQVNHPASRKHLVQGMRRLFDDEAVHLNCAVVRARMESGEASCARALNAIESVASGTLRSRRPLVAARRRQAQLWTV